MSISEELAEKLLVIANNIATESEAVEQQTELLQQIRTALVGKTVPGDPGDSGSYDEGYADGQQDVLDIVNYELAGRNLGTAETADDVSSALDNAFIEVSDVAYGYGKQAEYDLFWDAYQENGNRANYQRGFYMWPNAAFNPKYGINGNLTEAFFTSTITSVKVPIVTGSNSAQNVFYKCGNLVSVESIDITGVTSTQNMFYSCFALEEIRFEGTIESSLSFVYSRNLSTESVQSIIDHLKDLTGATAQTLTFHATVGANLTDEQKAAISAKNWTLAY